MRQIEPIEAGYAKTMGASLLSVQDQVEVSQCKLLQWLTECYLESNLEPLWTKRNPVTFGLKQKSLRIRGISNTNEVPIRYCYYPPQMLFRAFHVTFLKLLSELATMILSFRLNDHMLTQIFSLLKLCFKI